MKNIRNHITVLLIFICLGSFAQTGKKEKTPLQEERGNALKEWFSNGIIVADVNIDTAIWVNTGTILNNGYLCCKVKINKVLKGNLNLGYLNLKVQGNEIVSVEDPDEKNSMNDIHAGSRYIIKLKKTRINAEGFITENIGVYTATGEHILFDKGCKKKEIGFDEKINGKEYSFKNEADLYKALEEYCVINHGTKNTYITSKAK